MVWTLPTISNGRWMLWRRLLRIWYVGPVYSLTVKKVTSCRWKNAKVIDVPFQAYRTWQQRYPTSERPTFFLIHCMTARARKVSIRRWWEILLKVSFLISARAIWIPVRSFLGYHQELGIPRCATPGAESCQRHCFTDGPVSNLQAFLVVAESKSTLSSIYIYSNA